MLISGTSNEPSVEMLVSSKTLGKSYNVQQQSTFLILCVCYYFVGQKSLVLLKVCFSWTSAVCVSKYDLLMSNLDTSFKGSKDQYTNLLTTAHNQPEEGKWTFNARHGLSCIITLGMAIVLHVHSVW